MKDCPKCGSTNHADTDRYCWKDGTPLQRRAVHSCGRLLHPRDKFCPQCGEDLAEKPAPVDMERS